MLWILKVTNSVCKMVSEVLHYYIRLEGDFKIVLSPRKGCKAKKVWARRLDYWLAKVAVISSRRYKQL
jgi:hypothetical protein